MGERKRAGNNRLAGNNRGEQRQNDHRHAHQIGNHQEERILDHFCRADRIERQHKCALPHVVQHQRGQHEAHPRNADRAAAEMAHIRIQRLCPGHRQHHAAQGNEGAEAIGHEEIERIYRVDCLQHDRRIGGKVEQAQRRQRKEIGYHHRAEYAPDSLSPARLNGEQAEQNRHGCRHDPAFETGHDILQALGRRQHRDCRSDHRIAVKQRRGEHTQQHQYGGEFRIIGLAVEQRQQGEAAPFALVIRFHDGEHVFERHHHHHRPEHQAEHAVNMRGVGLNARHAIMRSEGFAESV